MADTKTVQTVHEVHISNLDAQTYSKAEDWNTFLADQNTLDNIPYHLSWIALFSHLRKRNKYFQITNDLRDELKKNKHVKIYPKPRYLYSAFLACSADDLKVVFIGQDPYFNSEFSQAAKTSLPQAMGMSFSVPDGIQVPSSLRNIFNNLERYGHLKDRPESGNLWFWAYQGCLMLNAALTVIDGQKKSHTGMWKWMTDEIISYISTNFENVIFVLWGKDAYQKINLIDQDRHHTIISSHPSGLSAHNTFRTFPAFNDFDHFGEINRILKKVGKKEIMW